MSYYRVFSPTKEMTDMLQSKSKHADNHCPSSVLFELSIYCMQDHSKDAIGDVIKHIRYLLYYMKMIHEALTYKCAYDDIMNDEAGEFTLCGREYSCDGYGRQIEDILNCALGHLSDLACTVDTPDWFEESEKYAEKKNEINYTIQGFIDEIHTYTNYEIIDMLKTTECEDDDYMYYKTGHADSELRQSYDGVQDLQDNGYDPEEIID